MASKRIVGLLGAGNKLCRPKLAEITGCRNTSTNNIEKVTHTGQVFEEDDYRNSRFMNRVRHVNDNWAIKLIDEVPPNPKKDRIVACDGGGGPLGHPKVYINLDKPGNHTCGYCGLRFYKEDHKH